MTALAASGPAEISWRDGKKYLWPLGLLVPSIPWIAWGLAAATGLGIAWFAGPILVFGVFPFFDWAIGKDSDNPPDSVLAFLESQRYYRWCTYLYLPLQYAGLVTASWLWSSGRLGVVDAVGLAVSVGTVGGIGINTAHELGHKKDEVERWLSKVALAQTLYGHFFIEHNRGHHVRVATPEDPASSRLGESFYRFWPRSVAGSFRSGWHLEKARLERSRRSPWTLRNDVLNAWAMSVVVFATPIGVFGVRIVPYLLLQAVFGFSLLEVVNYLEHYGLLRQKNGERYERCAPRHSWNSNNIASNVLLYHLQRHSDHHANPTRRYQALRHFDDAPELPSGYATMIVLAYVPPLWRRVMDPKVVAHFEGDVRLANLQPGRREKLIAEYGAQA